MLSAMNGLEQALNKISGQIMERKSAAQSGQSASTTPAQNARS